VDPRFHLSRRKIELLDKETRERERERGRERERERGRRGKRTTRRMAVCSRIVFSRI